MIYIALLRGINVGGKNKIKMAALKKTFEAMDLHSVQTYIQSGNVLFESEEEEHILQLRIGQGIKDVFGLSIPVILRTIKELQRIAGNCPFSEKEIAEAQESSIGESLHVAFLDKIPSQEGIDRLNTYKSEFDDFHIVGREAFLLFRKSIRNSKLASNLHKLGVSVTVRNWKTVNKLVDLAMKMKK